MQTSPKRSSPSHLIPKLEAEIRHNQRRIERLRQRNAQLTQRLEQIEPKYQPLPQQKPLCVGDSLPLVTGRHFVNGTRIAARAAATATRTAKSRPLRTKPLQLSRSLPAIGMLCLCLTICCGVIGFAAARLIVVR